jgi:hypothetical protein
MILRQHGTDDDDDDGHDCDRGDHPDDPAHDGLP